MDFWETTSGLFSFSATLGSTVDTSFRQSRGDTTSAVLGQGYVVFYARPVETTSWSKMDVSFTFRGGDEAFEKKFSVEASGLSSSRLQAIVQSMVAGHPCTTACRWRESRRCVRS